jgi:excisionase family DNA binding protein
MKGLVEDVDGGGKDLALAAKELAVRLGVSLRHVQRLDSTGKLPLPVRFGRSVRWCAEEIAAWLLAGAPDRKTWNAMSEKRNGRRVG